MALIYPKTLGGRTMRRLELGFLVWTIVWFGLAAYTAHEVLALGDLSDTVVKAGIAVDTTGHALQTIGNIPFVGGQIHTLADQVRVAGKSAEFSGHSSQGSVQNLGILLGVAIGLIPTVPILGLYLPLRLAWRRERRAISQALRRSGGDPALEEYLARRALENLPYHELREVSENPWRDVDGTGRRRLADAELRRLGLSATTPGRPAADDVSP